MSALPYTDAEIAERKKNADDLLRGGYMQPDEHRWHATLEEVKAQLDSSDELYRSAMERWNSSQDELREAERMLDQYARDANALQDEVSRDHYRIALAASQARVAELEAALRAGDGMIRKLLAGKVTDLDTENVAHAIAAALSAPSPQLDRALRK